MNVRVLKVYMELCLDNGIGYSWEGLKRFDKEVVGNYIKLCSSQGIQPNFNSLKEYCDSMIKAKVMNI